MFTLENYRAKIEYRECLLRNANNLISDIISTVSKFRTAASFAAKALCAELKYIHRMYAGYVREIDRINTELRRLENDFYKKDIGWIKM